MENLVVTKKQIAVIEWDKEQALKEAQEIMAKYEGLEFTEEQLPDAKKEIAKLRKVSKEINAQALAIDKELTLPVKTFRSEVKEVKAIVDNGINYINDQITEFEEKQKQERRIEILSFEEFTPISEYCNFDESWLLKKWKDKDLKELFITIKKDLDSSINTISLLATTNGLDKEFYVNKLKTMPLEQVVERITEDMQNLKKEEVATPVINVDLTEDTIEFNAKIIGTKSSIKALLNYANSIGVEVKR
jgi:hypothetical protein